MSGIEERLSDVFAAAGCDGFLHVLDIDGGADLSYHADELVVSASVFKISVALEFHRQAAQGAIDPARRAMVDAARSLGAPAGISLFADPVEASLRDLTTSMITLSDAAATDAVMAAVGLENVNRLTRSLGLEQTHVEGDMQWMFDTLARDVGFQTGREFIDHAPADAGERERLLERIPASLTCNPARTTRTTPRETTAFLSAIWRDRAAPPAACAAVRHDMARHLQRDRIARGLAGSGAAFSGKTGSFGGAFRNDAGVAELDGRRYAIAVFTRAHALYARQHEIDDAIGVAARLSVGQVRRASQS